MSDEQTPPPPALRLKPRLRPADSESPPATPASAPEAPAAENPATATPPPPAADAGAAPKIRLKPRLAADPAPAAGAEANSAAGAANPSAPATIPPTGSATIPPTIPATIPPAAATIPPTPAVISDPPPAVIGAAAPTIPPSAPAEPAPAAPKIRLKPRTDPAAPAAATAPSPIAPPPAVILPEPTAPAAPAPVTAPAETPAAAVEPGKFKLKPKSPAAAPAPAVTSAPAPAVPPPPAGTTPPIAKAAPPPFPVMAPPGAAPKGPAPVPHVDVKREVPETDKPVLVKPVHKKRGVPRVALFAGVGALVLVGGFAAWTFLGSTPEPEPLPGKSSPPAATAAAAPAASQPGPTPSATLNAAAKAPKEAIDKAQNAIDARKASGQSDVEPILDDEVADRPATQQPAITRGGAPVATKSTAITSVAPGVSATTELEAAPEASAEFRSFVANAKISGVFQGTPPRMFINGRLARAGEKVDEGLGIIFETIDVPKKLVIFKDESGAIVTRKY